MKNQIDHYLTANAGADLFVQWLKGLADNRAKLAVVRRVGRIEQGNFGDHHFCRDGVSELRIDVGPGYRVYYALPAQGTVLILCAGSKHTQAADLRRAVHYWQDWQRR